MNKTEAIQDERALFEPYMKSRGLDVVSRLETGGKFYVSSFTRHAWEIWQARALVAPAPAPGPVDTWQERIYVEATRKPVGEYESAMCAEIADLRAALAAQPVESDAEVKGLQAALAAEKRKSLELQRVYDERGLQIGRLELRDRRDLAAQPAPVSGAMDEAYMLRREIHNLKRHIEDYCPATPVVARPDLPRIPVPTIHTEHEDCNCEAVGYAKGWNAAIAQSAPQAPDTPVVLSDARIVELMKMSESASMDTLRRGLKLAISALCDIASEPVAAPLPAEQAGDEIAMFKAYVAKCATGAVIQPWDAWKARAALAARQAPDIARDAEIDIQQSRELWEAALGQAAFYVESHCVDGEHHAETIMGMPLPIITATAIAQEKAQ